MEAGTLAYELVEIGKKVKNVKSFKKKLYTNLITKKKRQVSLNTF